MSTTTTLDFQAAITQNDENNLYQEGGDDPEKKTSCFGGFCSGLRVKLASKIFKILGN